MSSVKKSFNIWQSDEKKEGLPNEAVAVVLPKKATTKPTKSIRWSIIDPLIALGLTIASQVLLSVVVIMAYVFKNAEELSEIDLNSADLTDKISSYILSGPALAGSSLIMYAVWLWVILHASHKKGMGRIAKDFWFRFKFPRDIFIGLGLAAGLRVVEFGFMSLLGALNIDVADAENSKTITDLSGFWFIVMGFIIASILAPIMEELFFRGLIMQSLLRFFRKPFFGKKFRARKGGAAGGKIAAFFFKYGVATSVVITSILFGFMHATAFNTPGQWLLISWTGILGATLAYVTLKTKRLGLGIMTHIFFNLSGVILATVFTS